MAHAPSYYAATANEAPPAVSLAGDETADVCIVGAGYTGLSAALHLAERGYSVTRPAFFTPPGSVATRTG